MVQPTLFLFSMVMQMTPVELTDFFLKLATLAAILGGGGITIYKMGRMTQRFELIGIQQSKEITELKTGMAKVEGVLIALANQNGRIDRVEDRQGMQGQRIDALSVRFNALIDKGMLRPVDPMDKA